MTILVESITESLYRFDKVSHSLQKMTKTTMRGLNIMSKIEVNKYNLVNYFDVWGNEVDGWEVNNLCNEGIVELKDNATKNDIIQALIEFGFLSDIANEENVEVWNDFYFIELFEADNNRPICNLQLINA